MIARIQAAVLALLTACAVAASAMAHPHAQRDPQADPAAEALVHTPAGFVEEGHPAVADGNDAAELDAVIVDGQSGEPAYCRVNIVGADGNFYEPADNELAPWSLQKAGNRQGKGPIRYYGWFFYSSGKFQVKVPAGPVRIEVWKGYEYRPVVLTVRAAAGRTVKARIELERTVDMKSLGYYSGDTHIHLNRRTDDDDQRALDLMAAEDIRYGTILCMNDPRTYSGLMERQEWPQQRGFGPDSVQSRGPYSIASGQEYRCGTYGHICLLMHHKMVLEGLTVDPNNWPVFGLVGRETRKLGGYSFHAHGGYSQEIYADFAQRATDGVELLQFAEYRGISLEGWYRMLSVGYRFPAVGACDFPYCRALGDCRTYVYSPEPPEFAGWAKAASEGRSFFTTGPLLLLEANGCRPGDVLELRGPGPHRVDVSVRVRCEVASVTHVELLVNGRRVDELTSPAGVRGDWLELTSQLELGEPAWIAARAYFSTEAARADAEAHTNPIYVSIDGRSPYCEADLDWLVARLDERIADLEARMFDEKEQALEFFRASRKDLLEVRRAAGQPPRPSAP